MISCSPCGDLGKTPDPFISLFVNNKIHPYIYSQLQVWELCMRPCISVDAELTRSQREDTEYKG